MATPKLSRKYVKKVKVDLIEGELMPAVIEKKTPEIQLSDIKPVVIDLSTSDQYIEKMMKLADKKPEKVLEIINKQTDALLMVTKEAALRYLSHGIQYDDQHAMDVYRELIEASAIVMNDKVNLAKLLGLNIETGKIAKPYIAEPMNADDWEKTYKPGLPAPVIEEKKEPLQIYNGPKPKSVN